MALGTTTYLKVSAHVTWTDGEHTLPGGAAEGTGGTQEEREEDAQDDKVASLAQR